MTDLGVRPECTVEAVSTGRGRLVAKVFADGVRREVIEDNVNQVDFIIGNNFTICGSDGYYESFSNLDFAIRYTLVPERKRPIPRAVLDSRRTDRPMRVLNSNASVDSLVREYLPAHLQYLESTFLGHERKLAAEIRLLDCLQDNSRLHELYMLSQFSGLRGAVALGYPKCFLLDSFGQQGVISQCKNGTVNFTAVLTCGMQPIFGNYTVAKDGLGLYPFSSCYWPNNAVRFGDKIFEYRENEWKEIQVTQNAQQAHATLNFSEIYDTSASVMGEFLQSNPAKLFNILSEVTGLMQEHNAETMGDLFQRTSLKPVNSSISSVLSTLKTTALSVIGIAVVGGTAFAVLKYTPLLVCLCAYFRRKRTTAPSSREERVIFRQPESVEMLSQLAVGQSSRRNNDPQNEEIEMQETNDRVRSKLQKPRKTAS